MEVARQAEHRYGRKVAWGARIGEVEELFTTLSVPVMTRLRQPERLVLDTLVDAGVARSRSDALAWAVALVGEHASTWLDDLRGAMSAVDELRTRGPVLDDEDTASRSRPTRTTARTRRRRRDRSRRRGRTRAAASPRRAPARSRRGGRPRR